MDEQHKEKSRYLVKDFANTRDPTMFAAASDTAVGRVVDFKAAIQNYSMFTFDVTSAYTHAWEDELVFSEPPPEEIEEHGDCVWRSIRVIYGRRKGARSWQEHFNSILRSEEARQRGFTVESHPKCPTHYYVREADGVIELHVDDGHGCGKETIVAELLTFLSEKIEMKYVQGTCESTWREEIDEHPEQETFPVSVEKVGDERLQGECFSKIGQGVHRWWQRGIEWRTDVKVHILSAYSVVSQ